MRLRHLIQAKLALSIFFTAVPTLAQEQEKYCQYINEQAIATRIQLGVPSATAGITAPATGTTPQSYVGVTGSLSDLRKGLLGADAARLNCNLYRSTENAQEAIQYSASYLEHTALLNRISLDDTAISRINQIIGKNVQLVSAGSATRLSLYALESTKARLLADKSSAERLLSSIYVPELSPTPLSKLIALKQNDEEKNEAAQLKVTKQYSWDIRYESGFRRSLQSVPSGSQITSEGPYASVQVLYNLGSRQMHRHLDNAAGAYTEWKKEADSDVVSSANTLRQQIEKNIATETQRHTELVQQVQLIDNSLGEVSEATTSIALTYQNQLNGDRIMAEVEEKDSEFRLANLRAYLEHNFGERKAEGQVSLTFDDGFESAYQLALPILERGGLKATWYIITGSLGKPTYMSKEEVETLARVQSIGAHTRTHPHLNTLTLEEQEDEIGGSREDLHQMGIDTTTFAYPYGEWDDNSLKALKAAGFKSARTTDHSMADDEPLLLPGFSITPATTWEQLKTMIDAAQLSGSHLYLTWHRIDEDSNAISSRHELLQRVVDYLVKQRVRVVAVGQG